jgi:hypothetical protein
VPATSTEPIPRARSRASSGRFARATAAVVRETHRRFKLPSRGVTPDLTTPFRAVAKSGVDALKSRGLARTAEELQKIPTTERAPIAELVIHAHVYENDRAHNRFQNASTAGDADPSNDFPDQNYLISGRFVSGANGIRTRDLLRAKQALSQLSYGPDRGSSLDRARSAQRQRSAVEVEVLWRTLLEPQPIVVWRVLQELRRLFEHVLPLCARFLFELDVELCGLPARVVGGRLP